MSLADPLVVTVNAVAQSLARGQPKAGVSASVYNKDDGSYVLTVGQSLGAKRNQFRVRLDHTKLSSDPFVTANNIRVSASAYLIMDMPVLGYTTVEVKDMTLGLTGFLNSATLLRILGKET